MKKLIFTLAIMSLVLVGNEARSAEGWIKVYVGDSERNQVGASGSCTIIITPKSGDKKILKAELVTEGESHSGAKLTHGGQVITQGKNSVELVVGKPEESHGEAESEHGHGESEADTHGETKESEEGMPYFQVEFDHDSDGAAFSAVVIIKTDKTTFNVKGFEYPFMDYGSAVATMESHLDEIQTLIDSQKLLKVHAVASKISLLAESLPNAKDFPEDDRSEIEKTCKEIIALFDAIDKAGDAENKNETILVLKKYRAKIDLLAKHLHEDEDH